MGNDILKFVQSPASKVPAYSFNDRKIFLQTCEDDKTVGHECSVLTRAETDYIAIWIFYKISFR